MTTETTATRTTPRLDLRLISVILVLIGVGISGYLAYVQLDPNVEVLCAESSVIDCAAVEQSRYSRLLGIPLSVLGLLADLFLLALLLLEPRVSFLRENGPVVVFGVVLFAALFSVWLIVVQAFILQRY
jgi:uncharacterized membrane protein